MISLDSEELYKDIHENLPEKRYIHSLNVENKAIKLAFENGENQADAGIAAIMHDRFRDVDNEELNSLIDKYGIDTRYKNNNALAHGRIAAEYVRDKYNIDDENILNSIRYHTTGRKGMSRLEKIIFLADAIEKNRNYSGVDKIRLEAKKGLDYGVKASLENTINHLKETGRCVDSDTIYALEDINKLLSN